MNKQLGNKYFLYFLITVVIGTASYFILRLFHFEKVPYIFVILFIIFFCFSVWFLLKGCFLFFGKKLFIIFITLLMAAAFLLVIGLKIYRQSDSYKIAHCPKFIDCMPPLPLGFVCAIPKGCEDYTSIGQ